MSAFEPSKEIKIIILPEPKKISEINMELPVVEGEAVIEKKEEFVIPEIYKALIIGIFTLLVSYMIYKQTKDLENQNRYRIFALLGIIGIICILVLV